MLQEILKNGDGSERFGRWERAFGESPPGVAQDARSKGVIGTVLLRGSEV
jgi:hypothetical protein